MSKHFNTHVLEKYRRYRIRFRVFVPPGVSGFSIEKTANFKFTPPTGVSRDLRYHHLYSLDYDFSDSAKGSFNRFLDTSVLFGGGSIGGTTQPGYVKVKSSRKIDIKYVPKTSLAAITRRSFNASWSSGAKVILLGDTTDIEIGNYIFGTGLTGNVHTPVSVVSVAINNIYCYRSKYNRIWIKSNTYSNQSSWICQESNSKCIKWNSYYD